MLLHRSDEQISPRKTLKVTSYDKNQWEQRKLETACREIEEERRKAFRRMESEKVYWGTKSKVYYLPNGQTVSSQCLNPLSKQVPGLPPGFRYHANGEPKQPRQQTFPRSYSQDPVTSQPLSSSSDLMTTHNRPYYQISAHELPNGQKVKAKFGNPKERPERHLARQRTGGREPRRKADCEACISSTDKVLPIVLRRAAVSAASAASQASMQTPARLAISSVLPDKPTTWSDVPTLQNSASLYKSLKGVELQRRQRAHSMQVISQMERDYKELLKRVGAFAHSLPPPNVSIRRWRTSRGENKKMESYTESLKACEPRGHNTDEVTCPHKSTAFCNLASLKQAWL